jgi:endonuclease-3
MRKKERFELVTKWFLENMPVAETELNYSSPYELLVAVILSAQCTDKRVNLITPNLFKNFPDAKSLAKGTKEEIFELIRSCSYPNNKAKHLEGMGKLLYNEFDGIVPESTTDLQKLPGVGRKTSNVIAYVIFNKPTMAVDTHVFRVSARIGLTTNSKTPLDTEKQLLKHFPEELIVRAHHWLILHGRYICMARKPKCDNCGIRIYCKYYSK